MRSTLATGSAGSLSLVFTLALAGCAGGAASGLTAPGWYQQTPKSPTKLYFVGASSGSEDEQTARELAVQAALAELTVYCGATVKSEAESVEVERNGKYEQSYSLMVDIAGDEMTIREATVKDAAVGPARDGRFDAYVLIEWPKAQYDAVLAAQRDRAQRALDLYLAADGAARAKNIALAQQKVGEAKRTLGPMRSLVPVQHPKLTNTTLLYDAIADLRTRLDAIAAERKGVFAVAVQCKENGQPASCKSHRVGAIQEGVAGQGFRVSADRVAEDIAQTILTQTSPQVDAGLKEAGFVLAVRYEANLTAEEDGFTFVHCGARGVVYDTETNRVVSVKEVKPKKGGHVHFRGAAEKGCAQAERDVVSWLSRALPGFKPE